MSSENTFLVELGCEELPPKALKTLAQSFHDGLCTGLKEAELGFGATHIFATPRRLAVKIESLTAQQPDRHVEKRGPAIKAAFDAEGNASKAALGWARGCGIDIQKAQRLKTDKGEWLLHKQILTGTATTKLLPELVQKALTKLPIPKPMRWGSERVQFVRPVRSLVMLFGDTCIDGAILNQISGRVALGHRFMGESEITINHADDYPQMLEDKGSIIASFEARKAKICADIEKAAQELGGRADLDADLLDEVTALVEWPVVLTARFETKFLNVPAEALVQTMKGDQKYFPVYSDDGALLPHFIFVSNIASKEPQHVIVGNEKVVTPRLADAEFFFNVDRKQPLADYQAALDTVIFQKQLGTLGERSQRIANLAAFIADKIGADTTQAKRAGLLAKCDLMTQMVGEFPETQGIMGMHYARADGEAEPVARAIAEHYLPRFSGDTLPHTPVSCAVALAEKLDTLTGIFGIGQLPKGDKDPFALRRAAIGVNRILIENELTLDLKDLIAESLRLYSDKFSAETTQAQLLEFMQARLRAWYLEKDIPADTLQAVFALGSSIPLDAARRVHAVSAFRALPACEALASANKRVSNMLSKQAQEKQFTLNTALFQEAAETVLHQQINAQTQTLAPLLANHEYTQALEELAKLQAAVDGFFEDVMVMADAQDIRENRLALLQQLRALFLKIADIAYLQS